MATNASLLAKIDARIEGLLDALADEAMVEYKLDNGRTYRRAEFDSLLDTLFKHRERLKQQIAAGGNRVRVVKLGYPRRTG